MKELKEPKFFILIIAGLILIAIAGWKYMDFNAQKEYVAPSPAKSMPIITPPSSPPPGNEETETHIIYISNSGFNPGNLTIETGDTVRFVNNDTKDHWPASDVHPVHAIYPAFDPRAAISPGKDWSFTFERVGGWGMHDHLNASVTGKIIVE
jgi:plastocyanin